MKILSAINNKKGVSLIVAVSITVLIILMVLAVVPQTLNELQIARRWAASSRAFYAADSGINKAIWSLNNYQTAADWTGGGWNISNPNLYQLSLQPLVSNGGETIAYYQIDIINPATDNPTVNSNGYSPTACDTKRSIRALLKRREVTPNPGLITCIIEATGEVNIGGDAEVVGQVKGGSTFSFEEIFGISKEDMKRAAGVIIDPPNNYQPVEGTTWFELVDSPKVVISSSDWTGDGIIVVEGDLTMTGGEFGGIIWVAGNLDLEIGGNAVIRGAIFIEGDAKVVGTSYLEYDQSEIDDALNTSYPPLPLEIDLWEEM